MKIKELGLTLDMMGTERQKQFIHLPEDWEKLLDRAAEDWGDMAAAVVFMAYKMGFLMACATCANRKEVAVEFVVAPEEAKADEKQPEAGT